MTTTITNIENREGRTPVLRLIQITDSHLFASPETLLAGLNCEESLREVLCLVKEQQLEFDGFLCTGDLAQDSSVAAYQRFHQAIEAFGKPQLWIPGNHDEFSAMKQALGEDNDCFQGSRVIENWQIIMLNSSVEGEIYGCLSRDEFRRLEGLLKESAEQNLHSLICVHHNPVPTKATWLQNHCLRNTEEFFELLDENEHVKAVVYGHVHQDLDQQRKQVRYLASPSTSIQFHPENEQFSLDRKNPGYRWLDLYRDGRVETGTERVTSKVFSPDYSSSGY